MRNTIRSTTSYVTRLGTAITLMALGQIVRRHVERMILKEQKELEAMAQAAK